MTPIDRQRERQQQTDADATAEIDLSSITVGRDAIEPVA